MKYLKTIILIILLFLNTGCWNYRELNDIALVSAMAIDLADDGDYIVSVSIVNSKKGANSSQVGGTTSDEAPTTIYQSKAKSIREAINNLTFEVPDQIYTGHLSLLVLSEKLAKEKNIYDYLDYFVADIEIRKIFPVAVVENGNAVDAIKIILPIETITGENIKASLENDFKITSYLSNIKFDEILNCLFMQGRHPTISSIKIIGSKDEGKNTENISSTVPKASIIITGSAIFDNEKMLGYVYDLDSLGYNILRKLANSMVIEFPCDNKGNYGSVVIDDFKTNIKATIKDNEPFYNINIKGHAAIPEFNCKINNKNLEKIVKEKEKMLNKEMKKIVNDSLEKIQKELKSDVLGFGELLYKDHYKYWKKIKKDWDKIFPTVEYKIKSNITITNIESTKIPTKEMK